jgi:hypothetical protein
MNSFRQWTELNETIDGFYADHEKEYEEEQLEPTQINSTEELSMLNNSKKDKNSSVTPLFSSPDSSIQIPPLNSSSAGVQRPKLSKNKDEYDPYLELHLTCIHARGNKGMQILADNYIAVLHAIAGSTIANNYPQIDSKEKYLNAYNCAAVNIANYGRVLLGTPFNIFVKLPNMEIPPFVLDQLELNDENYKITNKKTVSKAKNAKATNNEEEEKVLIGMLYLLN